MFRFPGMLLAFVAGVALTSGCGFPFDDDSPPPTVPGSERAVEVRVARSGEGSVLVLVPVTISGQGPFLFALDTGSSRTVVDCDLVTELELEVTDEIEGVTGVTGATSAREVAIESWAIGHVELPPMHVIEVDLVCGETGSAQFRGLLGSDVLSRFGLFTVDYEAGTLLLGEE